jgi:hypothetical protein
MPLQCNIIDEMPIAGCTGKLAAAGDVEDVGLDAFKVALGAAVEILQDLIDIARVAFCVL